MRSARRDETRRDGRINGLDWMGLGWIGLV